MTTAQTVNLETKVAQTSPSPYEVNNAFDEFMGAFDEFKQANDQRLDEIEQCMSADIITIDKVDRINASLDAQKSRLDKLMLKSTRPHIGNGDDKHNSWTCEHKSAFETYIRKGDNSSLNQLEAKSLSVGSDSDGGYLVPEQTETEIGKLLSDASPIRAISAVRPVSASLSK